MEAVFATVAAAKARLEASRARESAELSPAPLFVPRALLEGEVSAGTPEEEAEFALGVEAELLRLTACDARLDLAFGEALHGLTPDALEILGAGSLARFAMTKLGMSERQASELKTLWRRLQHLPLIRESFLAGALPRAKATLIAGIATPETEGAWVAIARSRGTQALESAVRAERSRQQSAGADAVAIEMPV